MNQVLHQPQDGAAESPTPPRIVQRTANLPRNSRFLYRVEHYSSLPSVALSIVEALIALVDNLYPLYDSRNQTLHDKFAGTIVVMA